MARSELPRRISTITALAAAARWKHGVRPEVFAIKERYRIQVRAEFQNIFNRLFYSVPSTAGATTVTTPTGKGNSLSGTSGLLSSGWGYVNWLFPVEQERCPESSQGVARFTF